jgi:hypothetical protein
MKREEESAGRERARTRSVRKNSLERLKGRKEGSVRTCSSKTPSAQIVTLILDLGEDGRKGEG